MKKGLTWLFSHLFYLRMAAWLLLFGVIWQNITHWSFTFFVLVVIICIESLFLSSGQDVHR
jgi:hypothetical protein